MSLMEARSGVGGIEGRQSLGPGRKVGLIGKWEIYEKVGVMAFATDLKWLSRMTFDSSHKMAAAAPPCVSGEDWSLVVVERTNWNWATETDWDEVR